VTEHRFGSRRLSSLACAHEWTRVHGAHVWVRVSQASTTVAWPEGEVALSLTSTTPEQSVEGAAALLDR
jgi:hypothetical protein